MVSRRKNNFLRAHHVLIVTADATRWVIGDQRVWQPGQWR
jgi:hypothetical protein